MSEQGGVPPEDWVVMPISDWTEFLDRPPVRYEDDEERKGGWDPPADDVEDPGE